MRTVSNAVQTAITSYSSYKLSGKLVVYKSRVYFESYTDQSPTWAREEGNTSENPISEACAYNSTIGKVVSVFAHTDGKIYMMVSSSATPIAVTISAATLPCDWNSRVGIFGNDIWYYNTSASAWYKATFNPTTLNAGTAACITANTSFHSGSTKKGAIYPVSATEAFILYFDKGGIRVLFATSSVVATSPARFIVPTEVLTYADNVFMSHAAGAVRTSLGANLYITFPDGSVKAIIFSFTTSISKGTWSDIFTAIQSDLSNFEIANAFIYNNRIFLCGLFRRSAQFSSTNRWTFLTWSDNGISFSFDRRILVSAIQLRFQAVLDTVSQDIYFSAANRIHSENTPYQINGSSTLDFKNIDIVKIEGDPGTQLNIATVAAEDQYIDDDIVKNDSYATLWIRVYTNNTTYEDVKYVEGILGLVSESNENGAKSFRASLVPDGLWHTRSITDPFYMEIQGRETIGDTCTDLRNLYQVSAREKPWPFVVDLWQYNKTGALVSPGIKSHTLGSEDRLFSLDLLSVFPSYPVLSESEVLGYVVFIYGWSRSGKIPPTATSTDPTPLSTLNDRFYPIFILEDENGIQSTVVGTEAQKLSTYTRPPQTYGQVHSGSYPVSFVITNPGPGKKLIKVGVKVLAPAGNHGYFTTYYVERIEIQNLQVYTNISANGFTATPVKGQNDWTVGDEIDNGIIDVTDANGTLISGLVEDEYYALETVGGPWRVSSGSTQLRIFQVNNSSSNSGDSSPPWYYAYPGVIPPYGVSVVPSDNFDEGITLRNYRLFFRAESDHIYIRPSYADGNFANNVVDADWEWHLSEANPPVRSAAIPNPTNSMPSIHLNKRGVEALMFSSTPYSAYNFEVITRWCLKGDYDTCGNIGFGYDADNYVVGYVQNQPYPNGSIFGIKIRRNGEWIELDSWNCSLVTVSPSSSTVSFDLKFTYRDGVFSISVKSSLETEWQTGSGYTRSVEWDGTEVAELSQSSDYFHLGIYGLIDPPRFRSTAFLTTSRTIPTMGVDQDFDDGFDGSGGGTVEILGDLYKWGGVLNSGDTVMGPYQGLVKRTLIPKHTSAGAYLYPTAFGMEIGKFLWQSDVTNHAAYNTKILSTSEGYSSTITNTEFQFVPKLGGKNFYTRKSMRVYGPSFQPGLPKKVWITKCLDNVTPVIPGVARYYKEGTAVYMVTRGNGDESINLLSFKASSGQDDYSISDILKNICQISGTGAVFPGDHTIASQTLAANAEVTL